MKINMRILSIAFAGLFLAFVACQETPKAESAAPQTAAPTATAEPQAVKVTGLYMFGNEVSDLRDCETGKTYWVEDQTRALDTLYPKYKLMPTYEYEPVFVVLRGILGPKSTVGYASERDAVFTVQKVDSIDFLNFENCCESYDFWCSGTEPFWNLQVFPPEGGGSIVFREMGGEEAMIFPGVKPTVSGNTWTYSSKNGKGHTISAVVKKEASSDGMSDMTYPYSCTVTLGKRKLSGVALKQGDVPKE